MRAAALMALALASAAGAAEADCAALACLASPYGPGAAPGCAARLKALQAALARGEGLPRCGPAAGRDRESGWYRAAMGWRDCAGREEADDPFACGAARNESVPALVGFVPGSAETLSEEGERTLEAVLEGVRTLRAERGADGLVLKLAAVWESREDHADRALAGRRAAALLRRLEAAFPALPAQVETRARNRVRGRPLRHGVWLSLAGPGVRPDRTAAGALPVPDRRCGLLELAPGSARANVERALAACGHRIGGWPAGRDWLETRELNRRVGGSVEETLARLGARYGLAWRIEDEEVHFEPAR